MPVPLPKLCPPAEALATDADLVARFVADRDETAFAELVRHGPVVHRVCRRPSRADADDAFQAVFLVLACRAGSIRPLGRWTVAVVFLFLDGAAPPTPAVVAAKGVVAGMAKFKSSALAASAAVVLVCLGVGWAGDAPPPTSPAAPSRGRRSGSPARPG
jgi:hypothetical protein